MALLKPLGRVWLFFAASFVTRQIGLRSQGFSRIPSLSSRLAIFAATIYRASRGMKRIMHF